MAKHKKRKSLVGYIKKYFSLIFIFSFFAIALTPFYFHFLPYFTAPVIDERNDMVEMPPEMQNVLGSRTSTGYPTIILKVPVLIYHYIEYVQDKNDKMRISLNVDPDVLENQIITLQKAGYTFLTASDLDKMLAGKMEVPQKPVLLTFDDGYSDFYWDAYPILKKYNVKATQYVIVNFLNRPNEMSTSQVEEIAKDGLVEIGAHTMDHLWLRGLDSKTVTYEVVESKKELQDMLHIPITSFAYPYGAFDQQAEEIVKNAGFSDAMTTIPGNEVTPENKYLIYRIHPGWMTGNALISYISQKTFAMK